MEPFIGLIVQFGGNFAPRGWALCDGQLLSINANSALFSILGTTYGGDGVSTFGLPDLRGRVAMHAGTGPGLTPRQLGQKTGHESVTLTTNQLPSHSHDLRAVRAGADDPTPDGAYLAAPAGISIYTETSPNVSMGSNSVSHTGGGQLVNIVQPFQVVNYIIALQGLYPSRN
ncbi:phage Tail Collar [Plesiocystis pacifica SIR-1]|uniref:Phage Tail Collar n=1 Tax=Plesiocystis pacifica SIR-1 TaxID=391625 RepID=A6FYM5_9BACT|nr:tail fiber protein [Plesiocystis pacifica]EDM81297.1 phage Tail Collar [Plesiocystis pacifica SIR-1]